MTIEELIPPKPSLVKQRVLGDYLEARGYLLQKAYPSRTKDPGKRIFEAVQVAGSFSEVSPLRLLLAQAWEWAS